MIFTRYLYIKEEVENALLISLLKNDKNSARFWYEELDQEANNSLLEIYFNFYFTNNLLLNISDLLDTQYKFNLDIYLLRKYVQDSKEKEEEEEKEEGEGKEEDEFIALSIWIKERNYKKLAKYLLQDCDELILPYILKHIGVTTNQFNSVIKLVNELGLVKKYNRIIYLCFTMRFFLLEDEKIKKNN